MKKFLKEPLLHFAILGVALFFLFALLNPEEDNKIIIDEYDINEIISKWHLQWQRDPTPEELKGLLDNYIKEEIYYREALSMNLDHNDEIIRRRMAQKMEFLTQNFAENVTPGDEDLQDFMQDNQAKYMTEKLISFSQVFFSFDKRENPESDARKALVSDQVTGDKSPLPAGFNQQPLFRIRADFGQKFAAAIDSVSIVNEWVGPIESGFGYHLVRITDVKPATPEPLEDIREKVLNDYQYWFDQQLKEKFLEGLLKEYDVVLDFDESKLEATGEK